jgi:RNA recognition motif-containing protein
MHSGSLDDCNVFVKYLPHDLTDRDFYKMFKVFGTIVSSKIMVDQASGKSLGYGCAFS